MILADLSVFGVYALLAFLKREYNLKINLSGKASLVSLCVSIVAYILFINSSITDTTKLVLLDMKTDVDIVTIKNNSRNQENPPEIAIFNSYFNQLDGKISRRDFVKLKNIHEHIVYKSSNS